MMKRKNEMVMMILLVVFLPMSVSGCTSILTGCPESWLTSLLPGYKPNKTIDSSELALQEIKAFLFTVTDEYGHSLIEDISTNDISFKTINNARVDGEPLDTSRSISAWVFDKKEFNNVAIDETGIIYVRGNCL